MDPSAAGVYDVPASTRFRGHTHDGLHLCAVLGGGFRESLAHEESVVLPGMLRVSPSARHEIRFSARGARCLLVEVSSEDATAMRHLPSRSEFFHHAWLSTLALQLEQSLADPAGGPRAQDLVLEMLAQVARRHVGRAPGRAPAWLEASRTQLADECLNPPSAEALARHAGVHRVHLVRSFRDHFGCTLRGYVQRRRAAHAVRLLLDTDLPLSRIAVECGFADQPHLTRVLGRLAGLTPRALRQRARTGARVTSVQYLRRQVLLG